MAGLMDELTAIKAVEDKITSNKVANFAYTDTAYQDPATYADGVSTYDPNAEQNIPVANASTLKVNATILTKGWRAQASAITRMLMNHFLGRISYNLNKVNDLFSLLLTKLMAYMGQPNGLATLNANGVIPDAQLPAKFVTRINNVTPDNNGDIDVIVGSNAVPITRGFLGAVFGRLLGRKWTKVYGDGNGSVTSSITYSHSGRIWVIVAQAKLLYSEDNGNTWVQVLQNATSFGSLYYINGLWLVSAVINSSNSRYWSEDGKVWNECVTESTPQGLGVLAEYNGFFVGGARDTLEWSNDGKTWYTGLVTTGAQGDSWFELLCVAGFWVAVGLQGAYWSNDGKTWEQGTGLSDYQVYKLIYANGIFVLGTVQHGTYWSSDGKAWTAGTGAGTNYTVDKIEYHNGLFVRTGSFRGDGYGICWSADGKAWTQCTGVSATAVTFGVLGYNNGIWYALVRNSGIWYSTDGKVWAQITSLSSYNGYSITCLNGLWLFTTVGNTPGEEKLFYSEDFITWKEAPTSIGTVTNWKSADGILLTTSNTPGDVYRSSIDDLIEDGVIDLGADIPLVTA